MKILFYEIFYSIRFLEEYYFDYEEFVLVFALMN